MSSTIKLTLNVEIDGQQLEAFPVIKRLTVDEFQTFNFERATGGGYVDLPLTEISTIQALLVRPTKAVTLRLDAQSDAGIEISANGLVLILDAVIDAVSARATLSNNSGDTAVVRGIGGGT